MTTYFYIDETFRLVGPTWHAIIGGAIVSDTAVVEIEIALNRAIADSRTGSDPVPINEEFKCASFFPDASNDFQFRVCRKLSKVMADFGVRFLVSHAQIEQSKLTDMKIFEGHQHHILRLAYSNIANYLAELTEHSVVQIVVDLGLSKSFRPIYDMYTSGIKTIPQLLTMGISEDAVSLPNFRNLPVPLFLQSQDSRIIQFSDLVIGTQLAQETKQSGPFKTELVGCMDPIADNIEFRSVEWNKEQ